MRLPGHVRDEESEHQVERDHDEHLGLTAAEVPGDHEVRAHEAEDRAGCPEHVDCRRQQEHSDRAREAGDEVERRGTCTRPMRPSITGPKMKSEYMLNRMCRIEVGECRNVEVIIRHGSDSVSGGQ